MKVLLFIMAAVVAAIVFKLVRSLHSRRKLLARAKNIASLCLALLLGVGLLAGGTGLAAADIVQPSGQYVSDYANILSNKTEQAINTASAGLEKQGKGAQIYVVTINSLEGRDINSYAVELVRSWGIGAAGEDNGLLILVSMDPRNIWIEVGYGLEGAINDAKAGRILDDYAIPFMREDDFDQGITGAYTALFNEVCNEYGLDPLEVSAGVIEQQESDSWGGILSMIAILVMIVVISSLFGRRGGRGGPGNRSGGSMWPLIMYGMGHHRGRSRGGSSRGGGFGGGGFGGGGGVRGGGGRSGGGGAGRSF